MLVTFTINHYKPDGSFEKEIQVGDFDLPVVPRIGEKFFRPDEDDDSVPYKIDDVLYDLDKNGKTSVLVIAKIWK